MIGLRYHERTNPIVVYKYTLYQCVELLYRIAAKLILRLFKSCVHVTSGLSLAHFKNVSPDNRGASLVPPDMLVS